MKIEDKIYDMKLFEVMAYRGVNILRVPGGWVIGVDGQYATDVFVPFSDEFMGSKEDEVARIRSMVFGTNLSKESGSMYPPGTK